MSFQPHHLGLWDHSEMAFQWPQRPKYVLLAVSMQKLDCKSLQLFYLTPCAPALQNANCFTASLILFSIADSAENDSFMKRQLLKHLQHLDQCIHFRHLPSTVKSGYGTWCCDVIYQQKDGSPPHVLSTSNCILQ